MTRRLAAASLGSALAAVVVYLGTSVYLITYEDTFDGTKGALWSLESMTLDQQIAYVIAAYGAPALLVLTAMLGIFALARALRA